MHTAALTGSCVYRWDEVCLVCTGGLEDPHPYLRQHTACPTHLQAQLLRGQVAPLQLLQRGRRQGPHCLHDTAGLAASPGLPAGARVGLPRSLVAQVVGAAQLVHPGAAGVQAAQPQGAGLRAGHPSVGGRKLGPHVLKESHNLQVGMGPVPTAAWQVTGCWLN